MNILLVDDHALFREGLRLLVLSQYPTATVLEAASVAAAVDVAERCSDLELCLLDLGFKAESGLMGLESIKAAAPQCALVVVSAADDGATIRACLDRGAMSFIPKSLDSAGLAVALQAVLGGSIYLPEQVQDAIVGGGQGPTLTPREHDVLRCLARGLPTKAIAACLDLSEYTVKEYLSAIYRALGVHSRTEAVIKASRMPLGADSAPP